MSNIFFTIKKIFQLNNILHCYLIITFRYPDEDDKNSTRIGRLFNPSLPVGLSNLISRFTRNFISTKYHT